MIQTATIRLSTCPEEDPMIPAEVNGTEIEILDESGATLSMVRFKENVCTSTSRTIPIVDVSGIHIIEPL